MVQCKKGIPYIILFAIIRRKETTLMKRKWLFASLLLTAALTMTSCSFKLPVELPFKIPFITADRNTKQNEEDPSDPEKATDPIITDEPEVPENIDTTENTQSGNDHGSNTSDDADPSPSQPDEDPVDAPSGQENSVDIPVLMGGALPYTGMISILNEKYEDGTHRYDDMLEDGMSCIVDYCYVNPEDLPDTPEAYATLAAEKLTDGGIYNILSVYQDDDYTESLSYPVYIVSFTSGNNEDTNFWLAFMVIRDGYTYLYAPSVSCNADYTAEELGQDLFPRLFFSDSMDN